MIDYYFWPTPNGYKGLLFLEETGLDYRIKPVDIGQGAQFDPDFAKISANRRIPAIVDHEPVGGGAPLSLFESGAILLYLADKTGRLIAADPASRAETLQWLFWQMGGVGPMFGQYFHFKNSAPERIPYAMNRYTQEVARLMGVLDSRLADRTFIDGDDYSIADIATYPWVHVVISRFDDFPNVQSWHDRIAARPATRRAYEIGSGATTAPAANEDSKSHSLNHGAAAA
jgi:GST-like protein